MIDRDRLDCLDGGAGVAGRLPVHGGARGQVDGCLETRRAPVIAQRPDLQFARDVRLDIERAHLAIEFHGDVARRAEPVLAFQRLGDAGGDFLRGDGAACARHHHFGDPAGVDTDELVRLDRFDHALGGHCAAGAEIGRAKDRHIGDRAGMLDEIADAHDVADHGDIGAQRRHGVLRGGRTGG
jgi:hypothetical protein